MCHTHSILNMLHRSYVAYAHWCIHQHINQCSCHMFMDMSHMCMCVEQHIYVEQWYDPSLICSLHYLNMTDFFKRVYSGRMRMYHLPDRLKCEYFRQYSLCWTKEIQGGGMLAWETFMNKLIFMTSLAPPLKLSRTTCTVTILELPIAELAR